MQKLDEINIIIQLKGQNRRNTFKATSTTVSNGPSFQMLQKMLRPERTEASNIALWKLDLKRIVLIRNVFT